MSERLELIYQQRGSIVAALAFSWIGEDLEAAVDHVLIIADAPSYVKDALSLGLLSGELARDGHSLRGELALTDDGRALVLRCREELRAMT